MAAHQPTRRVGLEVPKMRELAVDQEWEPVFGRKSFLDVTLANVPMTDLVPLFALTQISGEMAESEFRSH